MLPSASSKTELGVTEAGDFRLSESRWYEGAHEKLMKGEHFGAE